MATYATTEALLEEALNSISTLPTAEIWDRLKELNPVWEDPAVAFSLAEKLWRRCYEGTRNVSYSGQLTQEEFLLFQRRAQALELLEQTRLPALWAYESRQRFSEEG